MSTFHLNQARVPRSVLPLSSGLSHGREWRQPQSAAARRGDANRRLRRLRRCARGPPHPKRSHLTLSVALDATYDDLADVGCVPSEAESITGEAAVTLLELGRVEEAVEAYRSVRSGRTRSLNLEVALAANMGRHAYVVADKSLLTDCLAMPPDKDDAVWEDGLSGGPELAWLMALRNNESVPNGLVEYWARGAADRAEEEWSMAETAEVLTTALDREGKTASTTEVARNSVRHLLRRELTPADARRLKQMEARLTAADRGDSERRETHLDKQIDLLYAAIAGREGPVDIWSRRRLEHMVSLLSI